MIEIFLKYDKEILTAITAITLLITFLIKKIQKRRNIIMNRTEEMKLTPEEKDLILERRERQKIKLAQEEEEELKNIIRLLTPDMLEVYKDVKKWIYTLIRKKEKYKYPEEINEIINEEMKEKKEKIEYDEE